MEKIIILDKDLTQKALITNWVSFSYNQQLNTMGSFELVINVNDRQAEYIEIGQILYFTETLCGYINYMEVVSEENKAQENLVITGIELKDIISHRVIVPESGLENVSYASQRVGYIVGDLISICMVNPTETARKVDNLSTTYNDIGSVIDYSARYKSLDTEVYELLAIDQLGLRASVDLEVKSMAILVFEGIDRTWGQSTNTRAIFSIRLNTLRTATTVLDASTYKTIGYIAGKGEGTDREIIMSYNDALADGIHRVEAFVDARDVESTAALIARGESKMVDLGRAYSITGEAVRSDTVVYNIGDIVTVEDRFGNIDDVQITAIAYNYAGASPSTKQVTFGKAPDTLSQAINKRLSGINNILTN